jgi:catechol 2,3-dioxygenase-like lactoylglutathione lyase family enzyme
MKLRHIGITVTNMEKSLKLYRDYFGFEVVWDELERGEFIDNLSAEKDVRVRTVKMKDESGGMIELLYYYSHSENNAENLTNKIMKIGCSHFALTVDDLDKVYGELKDMGLKFNCKPKISPDGNAKVCFCRDSDGTLIELVEEL